MSRWQEAKPGIERAQCVMRPMKPVVSTTYGHADYVRTFHYADGERRLPVGPDNPAFPAIQPFNGDGFGLPFFADDSERSRTISAERVESAVEIADFLAICRDEALSVRAYSNGNWRVWDPFTTLPIPTIAKSIRGAYLAYHAARNRSE